MWMRRASRGRLLSPESVRDVRGMSDAGGRVAGCGGALAAGSEGGGVAGWPLTVGEAIVRVYSGCDGG